MNFVRKITSSEALKHIVDLPESLQNQDLELIILPIGERSSIPYTSQSSPTARGALKQYANAELIEHENNAWKESVQDKYEDR